MSKLDELAVQLEAAETVEEINELKSAIEAEQQLQSAIAEKAAILDGMKASEPVEVKGEDAKTLGEYAEKNLDLDAMRQGRAKSAGTGYGFKAYTDVHTAPQITVASQNIVDFAEPDRIRGLFGSEAISGNALTYFQMGATEQPSGGSPASVAQGATKPQLHLPSPSPCRRSRAGSTRRTNCWQMPRSSAPRSTTAACSSSATPSTPTLRRNCSARPASRA